MPMRCICCDTVVLALKIIFHYPLQTKPKRSIRNAAIAAKSCNVAEAKITLNFFMNGPHGLIDQFFIG